MTRDFNVYIRMGSALHAVYNSNPSSGFTLRFSLYIRGLQSLQNTKILERDGEITESWILSVYMLYGFLESLFIRSIIVYICSPFLIEIRQKREKKLKKATKMFQMVLISAVIWMLILAPTAKSTELSVSEKSFAFLRDVSGLDLAKYNVTLVSYYSRPYDPERAFDEQAKYTLEASGSKLEAFCSFRNGSFAGWLLNVFEGSPLFAQPSTNVLDFAKGFLLRYQSYSRAPYLQEMCNLLGNVTELKPLTATGGNVKLTIETFSAYTANYTAFKWTQIVNGFDVSPKGVGFVFHNGILESMTDDWNRSQTGSTEMKVSKEDAIRIAKENIQNYSYTVGNGAVTVSNFTIVESEISANSWMTPDSSRGYLLYPIWNVYVPLAKVYPGAVTYFQVLIWADTGEVLRIVPLGSYGEPPPEDSQPEPTESPSETPTMPPQTDNGQAPPTAMYVAAIATVITVAIATATAALRKRRT